MKIINSEKPLMLRTCSFCTDYNWCWESALSGQFICKACYYTGKDQKGTDRIAEKVQHDNRQTPVGSEQQGEGMSTSTVIEARKSSYEPSISYELRAKVSQTLKRVMQEDSLGWWMLADDEQESLHMIAHKISRIVGGRYDRLDAWQDVIGYATLVVDRMLEERSKDAAK